MCDETISQALKGSSDEEDGFVDTFVAEAISKSGEETEESRVEDVVWMTLKQSVTAVQEGQISPTDKTMAEIASNTKMATASPKDMNLKTEEPKTEPKIENQVTSTESSSTLKYHIEATEETKTPHQIEGENGKPAFDPVQIEKGQVGGSDTYTQTSEVKDLEASLRGAEVSARESDGVPEMTRCDVIQSSGGQKVGTKKSRKTNIFRRLMDIFCEKKDGKNTHNADKAHKHGNWFRRNFLCCLAKHSATVEPIDD